MLDERAADGLGDLDDLFFQERRRAQRGAPRHLVGEPPEEIDDRRHLGDGDDRVVGPARIAEVVADPPEHLVMIGRATDPTLEVAEVLDQQMARAVLATLQVITASMNAAEDAREPGDQEIVLGDVAPDLLAAQRAVGEALEVFGAPERAPGQQLGGQRFEPFLGSHIAGL